MENFLNILSRATSFPPLPPFFRIFLWQKGSEQILAEANFVEGSRISFRPRNRKLLGPPSLPCFSLSDLPTRAFTTRREMPFPHRFLLVSNAPHSHAFPSRYIATGIVQRAIMSISRRPINVTYINANNTTNISCCNIFKDWIEKIFQLFLFAMLSIDWETMLKDSLRSSSNSQREEDVARRSPSN